MIDVRLIAAVGRRGQLGLDGRLPWHDPEDLRWFREQTMGGVVVLGGRTWAAMPYLPGRQVVRDLSYVAPQDFVHNIAYWQPEKTIWIAGGAKTYARWLTSGLVRRAVITFIDYDGPADTWMPPIWSSKA